MTRASSEPTTVGAVPRPSGTVTMLFSDIEGSTHLWEESPEAMASALKRHDALLRSAIEGSGGYVFKTVGDAFCAVFQRAKDAVRAAESAQRSLICESWPGRPTFEHGWPCILESARSVTATISDRWSIVWLVWRPRLTVAK